uniref:RRM domain-containing protein n=1 Tax=Gouania willdenowi TaxID=441366 RepID=A0A8C5DDB7_GOUWI
YSGGFQDIILDPGDHHQLFVGNLPQDIVKRELKEFFMTYGNVVNLWINTKSVGGKLPNFGFVVFDNSDSVQRILEAQVEGPIMFQDKVRLKVKERKPRAVREQETLPGRVDMAPKLSMGSGRGAGGQGEGRFRTQMVRYPDSHQLFVGNIPHNVEKPELMDFFEQFGSVLDFKIISREKHPNFSFVVAEMLVLALEHPEGAESEAPHPKGVEPTNPALALFVGWWPNYAPSLSPTHCVSGRLHHSELESIERLKYWLKTT